VAWLVLRQPLRRPAVPDARGLLSDASVDARLSPYDPGGLTDAVR
jgi:hypothetical protein